MRLQFIFECYNADGVMALYRNEIKRRLDGEEKYRDFLFRRGHLLTDYENIDLAIKNVSNRRNVCLIPKEITESFTVELSV